jgi:hypothetical protein
MSLKTLPHKETFQVGMPRESDTKEIIDLPLLIIGTPEYAI